MAVARALTTPLMSVQVLTDELLKRVDTSMQHDIVEYAAFYVRFPHSHAFLSLDPSSHPCVLCLARPRLLPHVCGSCSCRMLVVHALVVHSLVIDLRAGATNSSRFERDLSYGSIRCQGDERVQEVPLIAGDVTSMLRNGHSPTLYYESQFFI